MVGSVNGIVCCTTWGSRSCCSWKWFCLRAGFLWTSVEYNLFETRFWYIIEIFILSIQYALCKRLTPNQCKCRHILWKFPDFHTLSFRLLLHNPQSTYLPFVVLLPNHCQSHTSIVKCIASTLRSLGASIYMIRKDKSVRLFKHQLYNDIKCYVSKSNQT